MVLTGLAVKITILQSSHAPDLTLVGYYLYGYMNESIFSLIFQTPDDNGTS